MDDSDFKIGAEAYKKNDYPRAIEYLERSARNGNAVAAHWLAHIYFYDTGFYDEAKYRYWFKKSAEGGVPEGMFYHGQALLYGLGQEQDIKAGIALLESCEEYVLEAKLRLAQAYMGECGPEAMNPDKAFAYSCELYEAEKRGEYFELLSGEALMGSLLLGRCYEEGYGTAIDLEKAIEIYSAAAEHSYSLCNRLGDLYANKLGDLHTAIAWFEQGDRIQSRQDYSSSRAQELKMKLKEMEKAGKEGNSPEKSGEL